MKLVFKIIYHENGEIIEWQWAKNLELPNYRPFWTSCYFIDGILIDSGAPAAVKDFENFLEILKPKKVEICILSHSHEDHSGGLQLLSKKFDIPIYASPEAVSILKNGLLLPEYRQLIWGKKIEPINIIQFPNNVILSKNKKFEFTLFPMPGHSPDQIVFIETEHEWAFVTDAIQIRYKRIFGGNSSIQEDIKIIYDSISRLYHFTKGMNNLKIFLQGHKPLSSDFLKEKLHEIENLREQVHHLNQQGLNSKEIAEELFGNDIYDILTEGRLSTKHLVSSLLKWS